jgi:hypothetical protein
MSNPEVVTPPVAVAEQQPHTPELHDYAGAAAVEATSPWAQAGAPAEASADTSGSAELDARLQHIAAGGHIEEGDNRMYDVNAAHEAAIQENQNRTLGMNIEAAHQMALDEEVERKAALGPVAAKPEETPEAKNEPAAAQKETAKGQEDVVAEAAKAMAQAGAGQLAPNSQVEKNPITHEITVKTGNDIKVLHPQATGGYRSVSYNVNPITGTVVKSEGGISTTFTSQGQLEAASADTPESEIEFLPPAVARAAGFRAAVKKNAVQPAPAETIA